MDATGTIVVWAGQWCDVTLRWSEGSGEVCGGLRVPAGSEVRSQVV